MLEFGLIIGNWVTVLFIMLVVNARYLTKLIFALAMSWLRCVTLTSPPDQN